MLLLPLLPPLQLLLPLLSLPILMPATAPRRRCRYYCRCCQCHCCCSHCYHFDAGHGGERAGEGWPAQTTPARPRQRRQTPRGRRAPGLTARAHAWQTKPTTTARWSLHTHTFAGAGATDVSVYFEENATCAVKMTSIVVVSSALKRQTSAA